MDDDDYISPADEAAFREYLAWVAGRPPPNPNDSGGCANDDSIPF